MDMDFEILRYTQDKHPDSHIHEHYEIFISLSNEGKFFVREEGYPLRFGMIFILNPFEIHRCFCKGNQPYDRYVLHFSEDYLKMLSTKSADMEVLFSSAPVIHRVEGRTLAKMLDQLSTLSARRRLGGRCGAEHPAQRVPAADGPDHQQREDLPRPYDQERGSDQ